MENCLQDTLYSPSSYSSTDSLGRGKGINISISEGVNGYSILNAYFNILLHLKRLVFKTTTENRIQ